MTIPFWPDPLPRPLRQGWQRTLQDGRQSTKNDAGPPRVRRQYSSAVSPIAMTIDVSLADRERFNRFWEIDTKGGSLPFWIIDPTLDGVALMDDASTIITDDTGAPILVEAWWLVLFDTQSPPAETVMGVRYRINFGLMVMPT
jgi:hypothetical protein